MQTYDETPFTHTHTQMIEMVESVADLTCTVHAWRRPPVLHFWLFLYWALSFPSMTDTPQSWHSTCLDAQLMQSAAPALLNLVRHRLHSLEAFDLLLPAFMRFLPAYTSLSM